MEITLDQFCNQWISEGSIRPILSQLEFNIFDFTTDAGEISRDHFKRSFREKGFAGMGVKWPPRRSAWARRANNHHPMMVDTGTLLNSIRGDRDSIKYGGIHGKRVKGVSRRYVVSTNESTRAERGKRGLNPHSDGTYAAVHNQPAPGKEQRQFIGYNTALDAKIAAIVPEIFHNIPKPL